MRSSPGESWLSLPGQGPIQNGTPVGGSIAEQTRATLQNIAAILERLGTPGAPSRRRALGHAGRRDEL
jgi:enamine deaminase RidA (YjgF/YER057c/UK114 family)